MAEGFRNLEDGEIWVKTWYIAESFGFDDILAFDEDEVPIGVDDILTFDEVAVDLVADFLRQLG